MPVYQRQGQLRTQEIKSQLVESKTIMGEVTKQIEKKLTEALNPSLLEVIDDSESHRGHSGHREGGESHFTVIIQSPSFAGQSRVAMQRMVMTALKEELAGPVHALAIKASVPA